MDLEAIAGCRSGVPLLVALRSHSGAGRHPWELLGILHVALTPHPLHATPVAASPTCPIACCPSPCCHPGSEMDLESLLRCSLRARPARRYLCQSHPDRSHHPEPPMVPVTHPRPRPLPGWTHGRLRAHTHPLRPGPCPGATWCSHQLVHVDERTKVSSCRSLQWTRRSRGRSPQRTWKPRWKRYPCPRFLTPGGGGVWWGAVEEDTRRAADGTTGRELEG